MATTKEFIGLGEPQFVANVGGLAGCMVASSLPGSVGSWHETHAGYIHGLNCHVVCVWISRCS